MRTGELARTANVNVETLRFYEREGLLAAPPRGGSCRDYPVEAVSVVRFIRRAQELGFSLREIKELLALRKVTRAKCSDVAALARNKIDEIEAKIDDLRAMRNALVELVEGCHGSDPIASCPIIETLAKDDPSLADSRLSNQKTKGKHDGNRREN
jgi:Hg(II)-responsive transcriptional regulator